jgi:hypothetical protein
VVDPARAMLSEDIHDGVVGNLAYAGTLGDEAATEQALASAPPTWSSSIW